MRIEARGIDTSDWRKIPGSETFEPGFVTSKLFVGVRNTRDGRQDHMFEPLPLRESLRHSSVGEFVVGVRRALARKTDKNVISP